MADIRRQTAYKLSIKQIHSANYTHMQGWEPNYLSLENAKVSRVNVIAIVISIDNNTLKIDDGTESIELRAFQETTGLSKVKVGDLVLVIARPREYSGQKYLVPEIIKVLDNKKWLEYRKKEVLSQKLKPIVETTSIDEVPMQEENNLSSIINKIKDLDKGDGAQIEEVISNLNMVNVEKSIETLLNEGEIFEIRPGRLKVLD